MAFPATPHVFSMIMCGGIASPSRPADRAYVWDVPSRLFHWLLVLAVIAAFVTAKIGGSWMIWHQRSGLAIVGLLAFRFAWGFVGPTYARFATFVRGPRAIGDYLRGRWRGQGHNPLGALSVLALLGALALQGFLGLFAHDDIAFGGPFAATVDSELSRSLTGLHRLLEKVLLALIALHLAAIAFYAGVKRRNLVIPMISGWAPGKPCESTRGGGFRPFLFAVGMALATTYLASGAWLPAPPMPTTASPDW